MKLAFTTLILTCLAGSTRAADFILVAQDGAPTKKKAERANDLDLN